jgi:Fe-S cluster biogenesis protein NfuA
MPESPSVWRTDPQKLAALENVKQMFSLLALYFITDGLAMEEPVKACLFFGARGEKLPNETPALEKALTDLLHANGFVAVDNRPVTAKLLINAKDEASVALLEILPYIQSDGGSINVVSADDKTGKVVLSLLGACSGCPSSIGTLKMGIEEHLKKYLPWIRDVESDQPPREPDFGFGL